jgi:hypothetical protein
MCEWGDEGKVTQPLARSLSLQGMKSRIHLARSSCCRWEALIGREATVGEARMGQGWSDGRGCDWLDARRFRRPTWFMLLAVLQYYMK